MSIFVTNDNSPCAEDYQMSVKKITFFSPVKLLLLLLLFLMCYSTGINSKLESQLLTYIL